jgi:hypothetical protein
MMWRLVERLNRFLYGGRRTAVSGIASNVGGLA